MPSDLEKQTPSHEHDEEHEEAFEEAESTRNRSHDGSSASPHDRADKTSSLMHPDSPRHSYDYARSVNAADGQRIPLSRHSSAVSTLSRLRARNPQQNQDKFYHPLTREKTGHDVIVSFDGPDDPYRPVNWSFKKKVVTTMLYSLTTAGITLASSIYSSGIEQIDGEFNVGSEVGVLGTSLMLFGFGLGPLVWAPLSEVYGRKPAVLTPYFISAIFAFGTATAKDIQTVMITRFFAGFFGSAPITNTGGVLGDLFPPQTRAIAVVFYAIAVVGGPTVGPVIGGAVVSSYLRWRWTEYLTGIFMMAILALDVLLLDESCGPVLLVYKARRLRHESGNWALHAEHEEWDVSLRDLSRKYLIRPFQMLATPICFNVALYASFVYGILYANLTSFAIEFQEVRGWGPVVGSLPFLALLVGIAVGAAANLYNQKYYFKKLTENGGKAVPEARLPPMMFGSIVFAAGMFVFAWTSDPSVFWFGGIVGCALIGCGFFTIFQAALNYLIDTFQQYGASAIAANTFLRSMFAGAFPLFVTPMYHALGVDWATTVFAVLAVLAIPIPWVFFIYGKRIRARGKWSKASTL